MPLLTFGIKFNKKKPIDNNPTMEGPKMQYHVLTRTRYIAWEIKMKVSIQAHEAMITIHRDIPEEILLSITETKMEKEVWETLKFGQRK